eukprot:Selendium_serpulae@DN5752_c0_g1_i1.p1
MTWIKHSAFIDIKANVRDVFAVYHELPLHTRWSPSMKSVNWIDYEAQTSRWHFKKFGVTLNWDAVNEVVNAPNEITWRSTTGNISHGGTATFEQMDGDTTRLSLCLKFMLPKFVASIFSSGWISGAVTKVIQGDLNRFRDSLTKALEDRPDLRQRSHMQKSDERTVSTVDGISMYGDECEAA